MRRPVLIVALLASACSEPEAPSEHHLFADMAAWQVTSPRVPVLPDDVHAKLVEVMARDRVDDIDHALWIVDHPVAEREWKPVRRLNLMRPDVEFWSYKTEHSLAVAVAIVKHPEIKLTPGKAEPSELPARSFKLTNKGILLVLPKGHARQGFSVSYPTHPRQLLPALGDLADAPDATPSVRDVTLRGETRPAVLVPPGLSMRRALQVPPGGRLHLSVSASEFGVGLEGGILRVEGSRSDGVGVRVVAETADGARHVLCDELLESARWDRFVDHDLSLEPWAGEEIAIEISAYGGPGETSAANALHDFAFVSEPYLSGGSATEPRPNVLVVLLDTLRADALGCYGGKRVPTPVLDQLAADGVLFERARSTCSWTLPAHASLFASLLPAQHGVLQREHRLPDSVRTLAEELRDAGWRTLAVTDGGFVSPTFGLGQGFDRFGSIDAEVGRNHGESAGRGIEHNARRMLEWIDAADAPFFAFLHTYQVHGPYDPPPEYRSRYVPPYDGDLPAAVDNSVLQHKLERDGVPPTAEDVEYVRALYAAEVAYTDEVLGRFFSALRERGLWENTLIVVTSDHGEEFWEHGDFNHAKTLYEEMLRVPLIVHHPDAFHGGQRMPQGVVIEDIAPTVTEFLGLPSPDAWVGTSLSQADAPRDVLATLWVHQGDQFFTAHAHVSGDDKWIDAPPGFYRDAAIGAELFDLAADPGEQSPIADAERRERHRLEIERLVEKYPLLFQESSAADVTEEELEHLRGLGYAK